MRKLDVMAMLALSAGEAGGRKKADNPVQLHHSV